MKRIDFLKKAGVSLLSTSVIIACGKSTDVIASGDTSTQSNTQGTTNGNSATNCTVTNSETAGPYPTKNPSAYAIQDIRSDRGGVALKTNITIKSKSTGCGALKGAMVDIWHCDADGNYSEYGSVSNLHFLRGRQTTDANGLASFLTIYPGWYNGRSPHIHVHVFDATGKTLLISQIAFPKDVCDNVYTNAKDFYKKGLQDTTNERDGIFSDGFSLEMAGISGSIKDGYTLTHTLVV